MKRIQLILLIVTLSVSSATSQESRVLLNDFNRWSIDGGIGFTKTYSSFSSGFRNNTSKLFSTELSVRYMFNEYLGVKADFGFNSLNNAYRSLDFPSDQYRYSVQGVVNAGRIFHFEDWTSKFNVLMHSGLGVGSLHNFAPEVHNNVDDVVNLILGGTLQIKTSSRTTLNLDASMITNVFQNHAFAGGEPNKLNLGVLLTGSVGMSIYIGKSETHADWYIDNENDRIHARLSNLNEKIERQKDSSQGHHDKMQTQLSAIEQRVQKLSNKEFQPDSYSDEELVLRALIKYAYFDIFFSFNEIEIDNASLSAIHLLVNYLKAKPEFKVKLDGFADELGTIDFNQELSAKRAVAVEKLLVGAGISKERILVEGKGEDSSIVGESAITRRFARRVSVQIIE